MQLLAFWACFLIAFISYFGAFGIYSVIGFPLDILLMGIVYLCIYFFAIKSIYKTTELDEVVKEQINIQL